VVNQDGVAYPGWAGAQTDALNDRLRKALLAADHVVYQSEFSKGSADLFLGEPGGAWEVLHNAVDVEHFTPATQWPSEGPIVLLGGDQTQEYRLELALHTFAELRSRHPDASLVVTGRLVSPVEPLLGDLGIARRVHLVGEYAQRDAPEIFRRAHVLLHTKVKDPCRPWSSRRWHATAVVSSERGTVGLVGTRRASGCHTRRPGSATHRPGQRS
jgi:glycosyltransferase involved in cell wall biosynthesis